MYGEPDAGSPPVTANVRQEEIMTLHKSLILLSVIFPFSLSFAEGGQTSEKSDTWLLSLPREFQEKVLWCADHAEGTLHDWEYEGPKMSGGGIFNTGSPEEAFARVVSNVSFSGTYSVQACISKAFQCKNGPKAVRLMRWTDKPWDKAGKEFPQEAYYSTWMMIPKNYSPNKEAPWDPGDGGWWNVFQFKSDDKSGESQPLWALNVMREKQSQQMKLYLYAKYNQPHSNDVAADPLPVGKWFHIEAFYKQSGRMEKTGEIAFWLNGKEVFRATKVVTRLHGTSAVWGIGNYTDHIDGGVIPGSATVYFDDAIVSTAPVHPYVKAYFALQKAN